MRVIEAIPALIIFACFIWVLKGMNQVWRNNSTKYAMKYAKKAHKRWTHGSRY